jgi:hypothetical protein
MKVASPDDVGAGRFSSWEEAPAYVTAKKNRIKPWVQFCNLHKGQLGFTAGLHTWDQKRLYHFHLHTRRRPGPHRQ